MNALKLRTEDRGGTAVVTVSGDVTIYTAPRLREMLSTFTEDGMDPLSVVIDLDACTFLDATGVAVMIGASRRLAVAGGKLAVACAGENVLRVLRTMGLLVILGVCPDVEDALAKMAELEAGS